VVISESKYNIFLNFNCLSEFEKNNFSIFLAQTMTVVIGDSSGNIQVYNESFGLVKSFNAHSGNIVIKPLINGYVATASSQDYIVKIWDPYNNEWTLITTLPFSYRPWRPNQKLPLEPINSDTVAIGGDYNNIQFYSLITGSINRTLYTSNYVYSLLLLNDGLHLAAGMEGGNIVIYDLSSNSSTTFSTLYGHTAGNVMDLVLLGNDLMASSGGWDMTVRIWNLTTYTNKFILNGHLGEVYGLKLVSLNILASSSSDSTVKLWDITNGQLIRTLTGHTNSIYWSVDLFSYQIIVSGSYDQTLKLWDIETGQVLNTVYTSSSINSLVVLNPSKIFLNSDSFVS
jgi:WD40 repeat protein